MSIAEMREKKEKIVAVINVLSEDKLSAVESFINEINGVTNTNNSVDFIYKKAVEQYHETLQKLAQ